MKTKTSYRITDWAVHFETPESRKRKGALGWVAMPTRMDGKRFRRLSRHERAAELFAAWTLIVEVAARCPTRGTLIDEHSHALNAEDLADLTGFSEDIFKLAFDLLTDLKIGWLEVIDDPTDDESCDDLTESDGAPSDAVRLQKTPSASSPTEQDITGQDNTGHKESAGADSCAKPRNATSPPPSPKDPLTEPRDNRQPAMVFLIKGDREWALTQAKLDEYKQAFPSFDVEVQLRMARQWCVDNPPRRKTARGMPAFLNRWLNRAQSNGQQDTGRVSGECGPITMETYEAAVAAEGQCG